MVFTVSPLFFQHPVLPGRIRAGICIVVHECLSRAWDQLWPRDFQIVPESGRPTEETVIYPRQNILQTYLSVPFYAVGALLFGEQPTLPDKTGYWKLPWGPVTCVSMLNPMLAALLAVLVATHFEGSRSVAAPYHRIVAVLFGITSMNWHYGALGMEVVQTRTSPRPSGQQSDSG